MSDNCEYCDSSLISDEMFNNICSDNCIGSQLNILLNEEDGFPNRFLAELKEMKDIFNEINKTLSDVADKYLRINS